MAGSIEDLENVLARICDEKQLKQSMSSALRRTVTAARVAGNKAAAKRYNLKSGRIKSAMSTRINGTTGMITVKGSPLKLMEFKPKISKSAGVRVAIRRGETKRLPHSFFVTTGGNTFHRTTASRLPIKSEYTVSIPQMIDDQPVIEAMQTRAEEIYTKRLEAEINRRLGGY